MSRKVYPEYHLDFTSDNLPEESLLLLSRLLSDPELVVQVYLDPKSKHHRDFEADLQTRLKVPRAQVKSVSRKIAAGFLILFFLS